MARLPPHFYLARDKRAVVDALPDALAGRLFKALYSHADGESVSFDDAGLAAILALLIVDIDDGYAKYKRTCATNAANAKAGHAATASDGKRPPATASDGTLNINKKENINKKSKGKAPAPPEDPPHTFGEYGNVLLTNAQHAKLVQDFGETLTTDYIARIDNYCQAHGKSYKDYAATVRAWIRKDGAAPVAKVDAEPDPLDAIL